MSSLGALWDLGQEVLDPVSLQMSVSADSSRPLPAALLHDLSVGCLSEGADDACRVLQQLQRPRAGHAVPRWSSPRAAWKALLLSASDADASPIAQRLLQQLCALIRDTEAAPLQLSCSWTCLVDKMRGVLGPGRWRRLEINDPVGSAWAAAIWRKRARKQAPNQYAYSVGRRHLHAVLALRLQ
ncbi:MAG: hypothetical protein ACKPKO_58470, partial [Candidatus Fonsibacter sp.]